MVENRHLNQPHFYLAPPLGVTPLESRRDILRQKTRVSGRWSTALFARFYV